MTGAASAIRPGRRALVGWILFDPACQPFFTLVATFVFAPYATSVLAPDPVAGQAAWGWATAAAGLCLALLSPVLGSVADAGGRRKPWLAACLVVLAAACALLWFAAPGAPHGLALALALYGVATVAAEVAAALNNAMMARLVPAARLGRLSGFAWAAGYAGGLLSLLVVLGLLAASPETGRTVFGLPPLFGLDPARHEGARASAVLAAIWLVALGWPLFVFTPDAPATGMRLRSALPEAMRRLGRTWAEARAEPRLVGFLLANMIYQDGLVALFAFGGIYGAGVLGWGTTELGLFGILLTVAGTAGAVAGGILEDRVGTRPVILAGLLLLGLATLGILSIGRDHVLFAWTVAPPAPGGALFASWPERVFLGLGLVIGGVAGPLQASSRTHLARLVPEDAAGRYFGLFALSGRLTSFAAPLLVASATALAGRQEAAPAVLLVFFAAGAVLFVRATRGAR